MEKQEVAGQAKGLGPIWSGIVIFVIGFTVYALNDAWRL